MKVYRHSSLFLKGQCQLLAIVAAQSDPPEDALLPEFFTNATKVLDISVIYLCICTIIFKKNG